MCVYTWWGRFKGQQVWGWYRRVAWGATESERGFVASAQRLTGISERGKLEGKSIGTGCGHPGGQCGVGAYSINNGVREQEGSSYLEK